MTSRELLLELAKHHDVRAMTADDCVSRLGAIGATRAVPGLRAESSRHRAIADAIRDVLGVSHDEG